MGTASLPGHDYTVSGALRSYKYESIPQYSPSHLSSILRIQSSLGTLEGDIYFAVTLRFLNFTVGLMQWSVLEGDKE
ncbi:hypothetical protein TNCV_4193881 [Trichonephila clavipes]|nr:hypothetical protein TNCV_4193881 [Trichonephila clavipes]